LRGAGSKECIGGDEQGIGALLGKARKGRIDFAWCRSLKDRDLHPYRGSGLLRSEQRTLGAHNVSRVDKHGGAG